MYPLRTCGSAFILVPLCRLLIPRVVGVSVLAPLRAPDVGKRRNMRVHRAQLQRGPAALRRPQRPRRRKRRTIPHPTTGVATQRNPVPILRRPVRIGIAPVGACIALAPAHARPVRRRVQGAAELRRRNPRLRHPQRIAVRSLPVVAETPLHPRPRKRGKTPRNARRPPRITNLVGFPIRCNRSNGSSRRPPIPRSRGAQRKAPVCPPAAPIHRPRQGNTERRPRPANGLKPRS